MSGPGGWRIDLEDFEALNKLPNESPVLAMRGTFTAVALDPRTLLKTEQQGSVGSCQGHAVTTVCEWCFCIATGGAGPQLSRAAAYYLSQEMDQIRGDNGSTVESGTRLASTTGIGEEKYWTYSGQYDPRKPATIQQYNESCPRYKIATKTKITSYEGFATFLGSGQGGIEIGIGWNSSCDRAVIDRYTPGGGGHALAFIALSERKDSSGASYAWLANSWGTSWGNKGWAEVSPTAIKQMLASRSNVFVGLSDMPAVKPREFTFDDMRKAVAI